MMLSDWFWKDFEMDLQEVKIQYLWWALEHMRPPSPRFFKVFLWDEQKKFCIVNSRFGRAFSHSPFGVGVKGIPGSEIKGDAPKGCLLANRLKENLRMKTGEIRESIRRDLSTGNLSMARDTVLDFYWLKLGAHELLFDDAQHRTEEREEETCETLTGIRNRIISVIRFGEWLQPAYVKNLDKLLPGFSRGTWSTFLSSGMSWNKYAMCAFDCGPVLWSKHGFVHFKEVRQRMRELGWPEKGTARQLLAPLYHIALDYKKTPIRNEYQPEEGYSLRLMQRRKYEIYEKLAKIIKDMATIRCEIMG
jgi:hypothetical protein